MLIALESSTSDRVGLCHGMPCGSVYDSQESGRSVPGIFAGDRWLTSGNTMAAPAPVTTTENVVGDREVEVDSSSSSSIGRDSDSSGRDSDGDRDSGEGEVQSSYKGPLDTLDALEEVLPMKRGISKFYCGKSKSFTSLGDAGSCSSIKDIVKPENAYNKKRKNLLAHTILWDKNRNYRLGSNCGGISKRPANSSRSTLALAGISYQNNNVASANSNSSPPPPTLCRPPLHPHSRVSPNNQSPSASPPRRNFSPWRSFSLSDLQGAAAANSNSIGNKNKLW